MDSSEQQTASNLPLDRLVAHALGELEKLRYSRRSLRRYRTVWGHLVTFSREMNLGDEYSEHLAARFVDAHRLPNDEHAGTKEEWRRHVAFLVKVLGDFARDGRVERTVTDMQRIQVPAAMKKPLCDYEQYCRDRRHLRASTLRERMRTIAVFLGDLGSRNVTTLDQLQPADIAAFVASRASSGSPVDVPDRVRRALLSAVPSAARDPAAGPQPGAADGAGPAGCRDPFGVGARNSSSDFSRWSTAAPPEASATTPSSCSHVASDCDWAISER